MKSGGENKLVCIVDRQDVLRVQEEGEYYRNHIVARVKEDLLKAVAEYFEGIKIEIPNKKQFVIVNEMGASNGIKLKKADNQQVQFQLYHWNSTPSHSLM